MAAVQLLLESKSKANAGWALALGRKVRLQSQFAIHGRSVVQLSVRKDFNFKPEIKLTKQKGLI